MPAQGADLLLLVMEAYTTQQTTGCIIEGDFSGRNSNVQCTTYKGERPSTGALPGRLLRPWMYTTIQMVNKTH